MVKYTSRKGILPIQDDPLYKTIGITRATFQFLRESKCPCDSVALFIYYCYTARWQKAETETAKASVSFLAERLGMSVRRVRRARNILSKLKLIEDNNAIDAQGNVTHWCVKVNHLAHVEQMNENLTFNSNVADHWTVGITKVTIERLQKQKHFSDTVSVWLFYADAARYQKTSRVYISVRFIAKGLSLSKDRVQRARKTLIQLKLIEDYKSRNPTTGTIKRCYVQINYLTHGISVEESPVTSAPSGESRTKCLRTIRLKYKRIKPTKEDQPDPSGSFNFFEGKATILPDCNALYYALKCDYDSRIGKTNSPSKRISTIWINIASNCENICNDPLEFMDACFLMLDSSSYPSYKSTHGKAPWLPQLQKLKWCQKAWLQRVKALTNGSDTNNIKLGEIEWGIIHRLELQAMKKNIGHDNIHTPEAVEYCGDPLNQILAIARCVFSNNNPVVTEQYGKEAAKWLRVRHAVAKYIRERGLPLPPQFTIPPIPLQPLYIGLGKMPAIPSQKSSNHPGPMPAIPFHPSSLGPCPPPPPPIPPSN